MPTGNPVSIILVEDDLNDATLIRRALRDYSQEIIYIRVDNEEALSKAMKAREWDIVLCDYALPELTLDVALGVIKDCDPGLPVIMVTGTVGEEAVADVMRRGVADVVLKNRLVPRLVPIVAREVGQLRQRRAAEGRMQRIGAVLGFFSEATGWREAMEASLAYIGATFGAGFAAMCELNTDNGMLQPIAEWADGGASRLLSTLLHANPPSAESSLMGQSLLRKEPLVTLFADVPNLQAYPLSHAAESFGLVGFVSQPLWVGQRSFGISLTFAEEHADLRGIQTELDAISDALRPVLYRKISDSERTLLLNALNATRSGVMITEATPVEGPGPRIVYVNRAACEMTGYEQDDLLGNSPKILEGPNTSQDIVAEMLQAISLGLPVSVELETYRRDGTPFWDAMDVTPVRDRGRVTHFVAIHTDITARRLAEQERLEREASFRMLFESNPMPMWVYDADTLAFLEVNTAAQSQYGWSRAAFLQRTLRDIHLADEPAEVIEATAAADGVHSTIGATHITASGGHLTVRVATHAIDYQGRTAMLAAMWDITEMERGRRELRRVNDDLARMTEALTARTTDLVAAARLARMGTWNRTFVPQATTWSPETYAILGQDPARFSVTAASALACVHPEDRSLYNAGYERLTQTRDTLEMEYRIVRPSGETRVLRELARPKLNFEGEMVGIAGVILDITEQKTAEQALLRAEKLKTIGQITGGIAHDFNNLLTVVGLNLEAVLEDDDIPDRVRAALEPALHAAHRGGELTAQMLAYARRQSLKPLVVDLSALIQTLQPLLLRALGERHQLMIAAPDGEMRLEIDPGQFENALMNIVINARDAMIEDGVLEMSFSPAHLTAKLCAVPDDVPPGDYVRVRIADNGEGIDPEILPRIFEPFFTTKPPGTGTGLGLSMVYGFVQQSRGSMTIVSTPGAGTTIDLYLPMAQAAPPAAPARPRREDFQAQKRAVLVVEDGDALRHALHHMFEELGCETLSVATAEEALAVLDTPHTVDLLFSDITLPGGMNGAKLASQAQALRPGIAVVLTSGDANQIDAVSLADWHVLPKPFRTSAVTALLGKIWA